MQPYIFPYIGYYQLFASADEFVFFDDVNYINKGWINRNQILIGGKAYMFSIPLREASQNKLICDTYIADMNWRPKLFKTIEMAYSKASEFKVVFDLILRILNADSARISDIAAASVTEVAAFLGIERSWKLSSEIDYNRDNKGQDKIIDICSKLSASVYINASGGRELYNAEIFQKAGIELKFIHPEIHEYRQFSNDFIPNLSIIDVLMHNPKEEVSKWVKQCKLYN